MDARSLFTNFVLGMAMVTTGMFVLPVAEALPGNGGGAITPVGVLEGESYDISYGPCDPTVDGEYTAVKPDSSAHAAEKAWIPHTTCGVQWHAVTFPSAGSFTAARISITGKTDFRSVDVRVSVDGAPAGTATLTQTTWPASWVTVALNPGTVFPAGPHQIRFEFSAVSGTPAWINLNLDCMFFAGDGQTVGDCSELDPPCPDGSPSCEECPPGDAQCCERYPDLPECQPPCNPESQPENPDCYPCHPSAQDWCCEEFPDHPDCSADPCDTNWTPNCCDTHPREPECGTDPCDPAKDPACCDTYPDDPDCVTDPCDPYTDPKCCDREPNAPGCPCDEATGECPPPCDPDVQEWCCEEFPETPGCECDARDPDCCQRNPDNCPPPCPPEDPRCCLANPDDCIITDPCEAFYTPEECCRIEGRTDCEPCPPSDLRCCIATPHDCIITDPCDPLGIHGLPCCDPATPDPCDPCPPPPALPIVGVLLDPCHCVVDPGNPPAGHPLRISCVIDPCAVDWKGPPSGTTPSVRCGEICEGNPADCVIGDPCDVATGPGGLECCEPGDLNCDPCISHPLVPALPILDACICHVIIGNPLAGQLPYVYCVVPPCGEVSGPPFVVDCDTPDPCSVVPCDDPCFEDPVDCADGPCHGAGAYEVCIEDPCQNNQCPEPCMPNPLDCFGDCIQIGNRVICPEPAICNDQELGDCITVEDCVDVRGLLVCPGAIQVPDLFNGRIGAGAVGFGLLDGVGGSAGAAVA